MTRPQATRAKEFLAAQCADDLSLIDVARACGLSRGHFTKAFRVATGLTPHQWLQRYRIDKAKDQLLNPALSIADIAISCGFADQSHLTRVFSRLVGDSPAAWRRGN
jgi:AraC family transcriptional regulator